jgi:hypothetical protein
MRRHGYFRQFAPVFTIFFLTAAASAFARDSRNVKFAHPASVAGTAIPAGEYKLHWESQGPDATVTLIKGKKVVTTAHGQWVDRDQEYDQNAVVYETGPGGSRTVTEMRFAGSSRVLILDASSSATHGATSAPVPSTAPPTPTPTAKPGSSGDKTSNIRFLGKPAKARRHPSDRGAGEGQALFQFKMPVLPSTPGQPGRRPYSW